MRGVADLADQFLDHVLESCDAAGLAVRGHHPGHVGTPALQVLEHVVQERVLPHRRERPYRAVGDRPAAALLVGLQHILDVEVADQLVGALGAVGPWSTTGNRL